MCCFHRNLRGVVSIPEARSHWLCAVGPVVRSGGWRPGKVEPNKVVITAKRKHAGLASPPQQRDETGQGHYQENASGSRRGKQFSRSGPRRASGGRSGRRATKRLGNICSTSAGAATRCWNPTAGHALMDLSGEGATRAK